MRFFIYKKTSKSAHRNLRQAGSGPACRQQAHMTSSGTWPLALPCHFL